ncbi:MAG: glutamate synthase subunit alpha, partial [Micromonosporaceae bacterium]
MTGSRDAVDGLYRPGYEHDSCGVAFLVDVKGRRSHHIVKQGLSSLCHMTHRGAAGAEPDTGDGAGILVQVPDAFLRQVVAPRIQLPEPGSYATGLVFLPRDDDAAARAEAVVEKHIAAEGATLLGWRDVPVEASEIGLAARGAMPRIRQVFLSAPPRTGIDLDRVAYCVRKLAERETAERGIAAYLPSLSARTMIYKGMLTPEQLGTFFPDLTDERFVSAIALVHSRFSTNTFPSWPLAHPYRMVAHNGEINTIRGNRNWMAARQAMLQLGDADQVVPGGLSRLFPVCTPSASDSATFDEVLEMLHLSGRSLPHAVLMMIPEAWQNDTEMEPARRAFYQFHSCLMEPWDGPACVAFTDGTVIGGVLDRNGLRPARWWRTADDVVILASEAGVADVDPSRVVAKGRLQPGRMFLVDTAAGTIVDDDEIKAQLAHEQPYAEWLHAGLMRLTDLPDRDHVVYTHESVLRRQQTFGYTEEELKLLLG